MSVVALDLGLRRIGVARSDASGLLALPYGVLERSGNPDADRARLAALLAELGATEVVVGLPLSLGGHEGPAAAFVREEVAALEGVLRVPVRTLDERFTTVTATRALEEAGRRRSRRAVRERVDAAAAAVLLQAFLDRRRREVGG